MMVGLKVGVHASHRAIEAYLYSLLDSMTFLRSGSDGEIHLRDLPRNCINLGDKKKVVENKPDVAIARTASAVEWYRENDIPTVWFLSGPPQAGQRERRRPYLKMCQSVVAYSHEHAELWSDPEWPPVDVCYYPIDTNVFKSYSGHIEKALMIATMHMGWWESNDWKGTRFFERCLQEGLPFQLIGFNNKEKDGDRWDKANPYPINDEQTMVRVLADHRLYAHTGIFLCRSPIEALAVGAPVVIRETPASHYLEELPHGQGVFRAQSDDQFMDAVLFYLNHPEKAQKMGYRGRDKVVRHFNLRAVQRQWTDVLVGAIRRAQDS